MEMFLDRIFGTLAAVAFVCGCIGHVELLAGKQLTPFAPPFAIGFLLFMAAFFYLLALAEKRSELQLENGELALLPMIATLPAWARITSAILLVYSFGLGSFGLLAGGTLELLPGGQHALRDDAGALRTISSIEYHLRANRIFLPVGAVFTAFSFVFAAYCLLRNPDRTD